MGRLKAFFLLLAALLSFPTLHAAAAIFPSSAYKLNHSIEKNGSFGDYALRASVNQSRLVVEVHGPKQSPQALLDEMRLLAQQGALASPCSLDVAPLSEEMVCGEDGNWHGQEKPLRISQVEGFALEKAEPQSSGEAASPSESLLQGAAVALALLCAIALASYMIIASKSSAQAQKSEWLLENETRAGIMRELSYADRIPTDISLRLGKSKSAISEHLAELEEAGFVERIATPGKKFVFYRLTSKGRQALLKKGS